jgi:hypothetical protein
MRVFTIFPPIHRKNIYAPELRELLSNGQAKTYARTQNDDDPLSKLFEDVRSSSLKEITRRAEDRALTALEAKALLEFKGKLFVCIREIANVKPGEQFWVVVTSETNFLFSGAALGASET